MLYDPKWEAPTEIKPIEPWRAILTRAANYIDEHGLCQGSFDNARGEVCILGALNIVRAEPNAYQDAIDRFCEFTGEGPVHWNDMPGRTKEEVVNTLREIAAG